MSTNPWLCHAIGCANFGHYAAQGEQWCRIHVPIEPPKAYTYVICTNQGCMATYPGNHTACSVCGTPNECPRT